MTPNAFRRIARGLTGVTEGAHHGHPDFRVAGRIFATLGYPDGQWGMVRLSPGEQRVWVTAHPRGFVPVAGKWGEQGATNVRLDAVDEGTLREALTVAWQETVTARRGSRRGAGPRSSPDAGGAGSAAAANRRQAPVPRAARRGRRSARLGRRSARRGS
jgi:hypothetical protein